MFTGFATENTPAIQVWNFFRATTGTPIISLSDDCAPIQLVKTGGTSTAISLYLPVAPIEGRKITIQNSTYGTTSQKIRVFSSDSSGYGGSSYIYTIGCGCTLDLVYSKDFISNGVASGTPLQTGWVTLNFSPRSSYSYNSAVIASDDSVAMEYGSAVLGGTSNTLSSRESVILGGFSNSAGGYRSSVVGGSNNNTTGQYSGCFAGTSSVISANYAAAVGGLSHQVSGIGSVSLGGNQGIVSGSYAAALVTNQGTVNSNSSLALGGSSSTTRSIQGNVVFAASSNPIQQASGVQQLGILLLGRETTNATPTVMGSTSGAASTTNQVILPNNSAYFFRGEVIAGKTAAGDAKGWTIEGVIKRGANAASTTLVGTPTVTSSYADAGAAAWTVAITADTTNGGLAVTVTGQAATTIRWVAKLETTEVTY